LHIIPAQQLDSQSLTPPALSSLFPEICLVLPSLLPQHAPPPPRSPRHLHTSYHHLLHPVRPRRAHGHPSTTLILYHFLADHRPHLLHPRLLRRPLLHRLQPKRRWQQQRRRLPGIRPRLRRYQLQLLGLRRQHARSVLGCRLLLGRCRPPPPLERMLLLWHRL